MRYWWVNHNKTFRQEFEGGYIWCPKLKTNNQINRFYENLREVKPGDLILSYAKSALQGFGYANNICYSAPQPDDFGKIGNAWNKIGWRVDVIFNKFSAPISPIDVFKNKENKLLLPDKYAPVTDSGKGLQGVYLAEIEIKMAALLMRLAKENLLTSPNDPPSIYKELEAIKRWEDIEETKLLSLESSTTKEALINARRGQGKFRNAVLKIEASCRITKVRNSIYLIASHIKPWRECDNDERLSSVNGLMLTPSVDFLFDRGLITFEDNGDLYTSPVADSSALKLMKIPVNEDFNTGKFNTDQKHFLDYHRKNIFLKSAK